MEDIIIIDVDGVVALSFEDDYYNSPPTEENYALVPNMKMINFINKMPFKKVFVSGRKKDLMGLTNSFLENYFNDFDLVIRVDERTDTEFKALTCLNLSRYHNVVAIIEDRMCNIRALKKLGFNVLNAGDSIEF